MSTVRVGSYRLTRPQPITKVKNPSFCFVRLLCIAHLLGWIGFLSLALFFTDFVGQSIYGGDPLSPPGTQQGDDYKRGVEFGSWGMAINAASSSLYCC